MSSSALNPDNKRETLKFYLYLKTRTQSGHIIPILEIPLQKLNLPKGKGVGFLFFLKLHRSVNNPHLLGQYTRAYLTKVVAISLGLSKLVFSPMKRELISSQGGGYDAETSSALTDPFAQREHLGFSFDEL